MPKTKTTGNYVIHFDGSASMILRIRNGKLIGETQESDYNTHETSRDEYAPLIERIDAATECEPDEAGIVLKILDAWHSRMTDRAMAIVLRIN